MSDRWQQYIEELHNDAEEHEELEREEKNTLEELGPPVTKSGFEKALNELKPKKTCGVDKIPGELLQTLDKETKHTLYSFTNNIYTTGKITQDFKGSIMLMSPKNSKSTKCEKYRTLSILKHTYEILTKIILGRIKKLVKA
jgi:hypothetical protein